VPSFRSCVPALPRYWSRGLLGLAAAKADWSWVHRMCACCKSAGKMHLTGIQQCLHMQYSIMAGALCCDAASLKLPTWYVK
jgi:hypothetical protein